jgi:hypothetical protein
MNTIILKANVFSRLDALEKELTSTAALAVSINEAVDRNDCDIERLNDHDVTCEVHDPEDRLAKIEKWITTADGVISNLGGNLQKLSDISAARIVKLEANFERMIQVVDHNADEMNDLEKFIGFEPVKAPPLAAEPVEPLDEQPIDLPRPPLAERPVLRRAPTTATGPSGGRTP